MFTTFPMEFLHRHKPNVNFNSMLALPIFNIILKIYDKIFDNKLITSQIL